MQLQIELFDEHWQRIGQHYWRGYAYLGNTRWTPAQYAGESFEDIAERLNGCFSWIAKNEAGQLVVVNDRLGGFPMFYGANYITDRPSELGLAIDDSWLVQKHWARVEALPGPYTLYNSCYAMSPSSYLQYKEGTGWQEYTYGTQPYTAEGTAASFKDIVLATAKRLIDYANGRKLVVLLSDGYDSRLILVALSMLKYPNLEAVTYGVSGNGVVEKARTIAARLSVPFKFIDYSDRAHAMVMNNDYPCLIERYANGQLVVQEQEVFAAYQLSKIDAYKGAILVPGISGDLQGGSYVPPYWFRWIGHRTDKALRNWLQSRLTRYVQHGDGSERWKQSINLPALEDRSEQSAVRSTEKVVTQERVSKYICSTLRVYEYYGFDWYLPQWDREFVQFWDAQPVHFRRFRTMYRKWSKEEFFMPNNVHFEGEGERPEIHFGRLIRRFLPFANKMVSGIPDPNQIAAMLDLLLEQEVEESAVNSALGEYVIAYYKQQL